VIFMAGPLNHEALGGVLKGHCRKQFNGNSFRMRNSTLIH